MVNKMDETKKENFGSNTGQLDLVYELNDHPPIVESLFAALQHLLAMFVGIIAPATIFSSAMGFSLEMSSYLISMALFASGVATFIQCRRLGPFGSGLLSIQGTSFAFLGTLIMSGVALRESGLSNEAILTTIFGTCFVGSFVEIIASRFLPYLKRIITPLVSGVVVTLIGLTLIQVAITDFGGGFAAMSNGSYGSLENLALGSIVLIIILAFNRAKNKYVRMSAIAAGLLTGYILAIFLGKVDFAQLSQLDSFTLPVPMKYGFWGWDWAVFIPFAMLFLIATVESIGDLTATSMISKQPITGEQYFKTISRGVMTDGTNSAIASIFNAFPISTFSQNNGVIQITGIASRYIGVYIGGFLVLFGLFPVVGGVFKLMPPAVLGGATIIMFGSVAAAGIKIISSSNIDRRAMIILATSLGIGLGVSYKPEILNHLPSMIQRIFASPITSGGLTAIVLNAILPLLNGNTKVDSQGEQQKAA